MIVEATISLEIKTAKDNAEDDSVAGETIENVKLNSSDEMATAIANAIKSLTITIPMGAIVVVGSAATQTNPAPIVLTMAVT